MSGWAAVICAAAVAAFPLGTAARAEPNPQQMAPADVERWLTFWNKLVVTVAQAQAPCDKVATDVSSLVDKNQAAIAIARTAHKQGRKLPDAAQQHMLVGVKQMVPVMKRCGQHGKVRAVFARLDVTRK